jgi:hypothetical protein
MRSRSSNADERAAGAADIRAAESIRSLTPLEADCGADAYFATGAPADALRLAEAVAADYPASPMVCALRAKALLRLGRRDEARSAARDALVVGTEDLFAIVSAVEVLAASGDGGWGRALDALGLPDDATAFYVSTHLAKHLFDASPWHEPLPRAAAAALDRAEEQLASAARRHDWYVLRQRAEVIRLRARCRRALGDEAGAAAAEAELAKIGAR